MRLAIGLVVLILIGTATSLYAAKCKVDGKWYSYDTPECRSNAEDRSTAPGVSNPTAPLIQNQASTESPSASPAIPFDWPRTWAEVSNLARNHCAARQSKSFPGEYCMIQEEVGFWAMRGQFGLPTGVLAEVRSMCTELSGSFSQRLQCIRSAAMGYPKFAGRFSMPAKFENQARAKCRETYRSYSTRASCMKREERKFKMEYGTKSIPTSNRPRTTSFSTSSSSRSGVPAFASYSPPAPLEFAINPALNSSAAAQPPSSLRLEPGHIGVRSYFLGIDARSFPSSEAFHDAIENQTETLVLTVEKPYIQNNAYLRIINPTRVSPVEGVQVLKEKGGRVELNLHVKGGRRYLVEFLVNPKSGSKYLVTTESGFQEIIDDPGHLGSLRVIVKAAGTGWTQIGVGPLGWNELNLTGVVVTSSVATMEDSVVNSEDDQL